MLWGCSTFRNYPLFLSGLLTIQYLIDLPTFLDAVKEEGAPPLCYNYTLNIPHRADWFVRRHVFGTSGYPWACPDYLGDSNKQFPCPNTLTLANTDFNLYLHENWGEAEIQDVLAIFRKVGKRFAK